MSEKLKLPLKLTQFLPRAGHVRVDAADGEIVCVFHATRSNVDTALHRAEVCKAALEADATKCCPGCIDCGPPIMVKAEQRCGGCPNGEENTGE